MLVAFAVLHVPGNRTEGRVLFTTDLDTPAPVATELGLHFEPCLVLVNVDPHRV